MFFGDTALNIAIIKIKNQRNRLDVISQLLANNIDVSIKNKKNKNALDLALESENNIDQETHDIIFAKVLEQLRAALKSGNMAKSNELLKYINKFNITKEALLVEMIETKNDAGVQILLESDKSKEFEGYVANILQRSIIENNLDTFALLIAKGANVSIEDKDQKTLLYYATKHNRQEMIRVLIQKEADKRLNKSEVTPLIAAICNNDTEVAARLIEEGANIFAEDKSGKPPVYHAAKQNNEELVEMLIKREAGKCKNTIGLTPVNIAIRENDMSAVALLVLKGADVKMEGPDGLTPLELALKLRNKDLIQILLNNKDSIKKGDSTLLHIALTNGDLTFVEQVLQTNPKLLCAKTEAGVPLMLHAVSHNNIEAINRLIGIGADINARYANLGTALIYAIKQNNLNVVDFLLQHDGCEINIQDSYDNTPLHYALYNNNYELAYRLIALHADITPKNRQGQCALDSSMFPNNEELFKFLGQLNCDTLLRVVSTIPSLLNVRDQDGNTLLHLLVMDSNLPVLENLIHTSLSINTTNNLGETLLHKAAFKGNLDILCFLIDNNVDISIKNSAGDTPLSYLKRKNPEAFERLINAEYLSKLLLHYSKTGILNGIRELISLRLDVNYKDESNKTALNYAIDSNNVELVRMLIQSRASLPQTSRVTIEEIDEGKADDSPDQESKQLVPITQSSVLTPAELEAVFCFANKGDWDVVYALAKNNLKICYTDGSTLLHIAAKKQNLEAVTYLMSNDIDLTLSNREGKIPLHYAAEAQKQQIIEALLNDNLKPKILNELLNKKDLNGMRAIDYAVKYGCTDIVEILIRKQITAYKMNKQPIGSNFCPITLHYAVTNPDISDQTIEQLINISAVSSMVHDDLRDFNIEENIILYETQKKELNKKIAEATVTGRPIEQYLIQLEKIDKLEENAEKRIERLRDSDSAAALREQNLKKLIATYRDEKYGLTPLDLAVIYGRVGLIHTFIKNGATPNEIDNHSMTPVHYAILTGQIEVVNALFSGDSPVNVNIAESLSGRTALHTAVINNADDRIITLLVNKGANLSLTDSKGCTVLHYAVINQNYTAIDNIVQNKDNNITEYLNILDKNKCIPLHYAVMKNADINYIELLKRDTNPCMQDSNEYTPLHYAGF